MLLPLYCQDARPSPILTVLLLTLPFSCCFFFSGLLFVSLPPSLSPSFALSHLFFLLYEEAYLVSSGSRWHLSPCETCASRSQWGSTSLLTCLFSRDMAIHSRLSHRGQNCASACNVKVSVQMLCLLLFKSPVALKSPPTHPRQQVRNGVMDVEVAAPWCDSTYQFIDLSRLSLSLRCFFPPLSPESSSWFISVFLRCSTLRSPLFPLLFVLFFFDELASARQAGSSPLIGRSMGWVFSLASIASLLTL